MKRTTGVIGAIVLGLAGGAGGYWLYQLTRSPDAVPAPSAQSRAEAGSVIGTQRPAFSLPDLAGRPQDVSQWDGQVVLLNFWATWCPPCRREIPAFVDLQQRLGAQGLQIVGVAIDQPQLVEEYGDTMGINYPSLVGETDALEVAKAYGNAFGQLPYSVIIGRDGTIENVHRGELKREDAEALLEPLL